MLSSMAETANATNGSHSPPRVGERAPDFTLPGADGAPVRLTELIGGKVIVLYFYPKDQTPGCTIEACAFRDAYQDFVDAGAEVVGVSRDDGASHRKFADKHQLPFRLLSDPDGAVHDLYGVKSRLANLLRDRISFVIDRNGVVRLVFDSMLRFTTHVSKALETVRALSADQPAASA
jgi:peroxiredoxin Q/BCP